jgi:hypothetical protein
LSLDTSTTLVVFNYEVRSDVMKAIILLPAHELLPLGRIKRVINNADKNVAFAQGADGNPARKVAIVIGAIDERHKNRGNLLSKLGCSALAAETCPVRGSSWFVLGRHQLQKASAASATILNC